MGLINEGVELFIPPEILVSRWKGGRFSF